MPFVQSERVWRTEVGGEEGVWWTATLPGGGRGRLHAAGGDISRCPHLVPPEPNWPVKPELEPTARGLQHPAGPEQRGTPGLHHGTESQSLNSRLCGLSLLDLVVVLSVFVSLLSELLRVDWGFIIGLWVSDESSRNIYLSWNSPVKV